MHVRYGLWCAKCVQQSQMFTIAEVHAMAKARDGVCLSERYTKGSEKLRWRCAKGHEWMTIPAKIKAGTWCPTCARHPHTIASMQTLDRYGNRLDKAATKEGARSPMPPRPCRTCGSEALTTCCSASCP